MEQVAGISCGGFLRQYVQEATGRLDLRCGHLKLCFSSTTSQVQVQVQVRTKIFRLKTLIPASLD